MLPPREDRMARLGAPIGTAGFTWAVGIEDTFIAQPHPRTGRVLDEYEITGHYARRDDLRRAADLGIDAIRWGQPAPARDAARRPVRRSDRPQQGRRARHGAPDRPDHVTHPHHRRVRWPTSCS
jgi:hypothetical protein